MFPFFNVSILKGDFMGGVKREHGGRFRMHALKLDLIHPAKS